jgi:hypothetical protein
VCGLAGLPAGREVLGGDEGGEGEEGEEAHGGYFERGRRIRNKYGGHSHEDAMLPLLALALRPRALAAPAAAAFFVPSFPGIRQHPDHPLAIYAGHLSSEPSAAPAPDAVSPHLFFVLVKNRRSADKERVVFWFNVRLSSPSPPRRMAHVSL